MSVNLGLVKKEMIELMASNVPGPGGLIPLRVLGSDLEGGIFPTEVTVEELESFAELIQRATNAQDFTTFETPTRTGIEAIQHMIDNDIPVFIPPGVHEITGTIYAKEGTMITGTPKSVILTLDGSTLFNLDFSGKVVFNNITLRSTGGTGRGISGYAHCLFQNVTFENFNQAIYFANGINCIFTSCYFTTCNTAVYMVTTNNIGFYSCVFNDNKKVVEMATNGISIVFDKCRISMFQTSTMGLSLVGKVSIMNCSFTCFGESPTTDFDGYYIDYTVNPSLTFNQSLIVKNNSFTCSSNANGALRISGATTAASIMFAEVSHNFVSSPKVAGLTYGTNNAIQGVNVYDNIGMTISNKPAKYAYKPLSYYTLTSGIVLTPLSQHIPFNLTRYDNVDGLAANPGKYTVSKAGVYRVTVDFKAQVTTEPYAKTTVEAFVYVNNVLYASSTSNILATSIYVMTTIPINCITQTLSIGDTIDVRGAYGATSAVGTSTIEWLSNGL